MKQFGNVNDDKCWTPTMYVKICYFDCGTVQNAVLLLHNYSIAFTDK